MSWNKPMAFWSAMADFDFSILGGRDQDVIRAGPLAAQDHHLRGGGAAVEAGHMDVVGGDADGALGLSLGRAVGAVVFGIHPEAHGGQPPLNRQAFQGGFAAQLGTDRFRDVDLESPGVYAVVFHCPLLRGDYSAGVEAPGRGMGRR